MSRWIVALLGCAGIASCAATTRIPATTTALATSTFGDPPFRSGLGTLLIAMPDSPEFVSARKGLVTEVKDDLNVTTFIVKHTTTVANLAAAIERTGPVCIVLMNNTTMALFQKYQSQAERVPPAVILMTSFIEETAGHIKDFTGIAYEVPGVTGLLQLRTVIAAPVNRVGVVYRPAFRKFIERQSLLASREHIELVPIGVPADATADQLRKALLNLTTVGRVDALWMLNDNGLIHDSAFLDETWRAVLRDTNIPLVVGVPNLVDPSASFGTLGVVPDHEALGLQAANLVLDLAEHGWRVNGHPIELPLSVKTIVDIKQVRAHFGLRPEALQRIDHALDQ